MKTVLSPSQYETFECLRRGVLTYVYGLRQPPTPAMELGTRVHSLAERYLKTGQAPSIQDGPEWQILHPGLEFYPPPGTAIVEGKIEFETEHSAWQGLRDAIYTPGSPKVIANGHVRVLDHKTTSDFKYMKDLTVDVQANLYMYELLEQGAETVSAQWVYLRTKGKPAARQTLLTANKEQVYARVSEIDARAEIIHLLKETKPAAADVPYNLKCCSEFGGCRFRGTVHCSIPATAMFSKKGEVGMSSILDRLKARKVDSKGFSIVKGHNFDTGTGEPITHALSEIDALSVRLQEKIGTPEKGFINPPGLRITGDERCPKDTIVVLPPGVQYKPSPANGKEYEAAAASEQYGTPEQGFINPPDLEPYVSLEAQTVASPWERGETVSSTDGQEPQGDIRPDPFFGEIEVSTKGMDREELKALCVKRGLCDANDRRREPALRALLQANQPDPLGATCRREVAAEFATGEVLVSAMQEQPEEPASLKYVLDSDMVEESGPIGTLYIACLPSSPVCDAQSIVAEVLPKVLEAAGEAHVKLVNYGKGTALLAAAVEEYLSTRHYPAVFADRFLDGDVLQVLVRLSGATVRGL